MKEWIWKKILRIASIIMTMERVGLFKTRISKTDWLIKIWSKKASTNLVTEDFKMLWVLSFNTPRKSQQLCQSRPGGSHSSSVYQYLEEVTTAPRIPEWAVQEMSELVPDGEPWPRWLRKPTSCPGYHGRSFGCIFHSIEEEEEVRREPPVYTPEQESSLVFNPRRCLPCCPTEGRKEERKWGNFRLVVQSICPSGMYLKAIAHLPIYPSPCTPL